MEWNQEKSFLFIQHYRKKPILWDAKHAHYYNKFKKDDAWQALADAMETTQDECKRKMTSLLASFRREKAKVAKSRRSGKGPREVYCSSWFAFKSLAFLLNRNQRRATVDGLEPITQIESESDTDTKKLVTRTTFTNKPVRNENESCPPRPKKAKTSVQKPEDMMAHVKENEGQLRFIKDECESFGLFIANKLKTYSTRTKNAVQHHISNILYSADQGQYDVLCPTIESYHTEALEQPDPSPHSPGSDGCDSEHLQQLTCHGQETYKNFKDLIN